MSTTQTVLARAMGGALLLALAPLTVVAQLNSDQQKCVNALNKDASKIAAAQGKLNAGCIKDAGKGKLPSGESADACVVADAKGKVAKVAAKIASDYTGKCVADPPTFGVPGGSVAAIVGDVPVDQMLNLFADVFGASLTTATIDCSESAACKCQQGVAKNMAKLAATKFKEFVKCKKTALKAGALNASAIEDCLTDAGTAGSVAADSKGKIAKAVDKLGDGIASHCASDPFRPPLPGLCKLDGNTLRDCIDTRVSCRLCLTLNDIDNLVVDCDQFDDGQLNLSCPSETFTLRSTAEPLNTPGSPPGFAIIPKMVTQFGSSEAVNLNNAQFTRFRLNTTATRPDAILILIPGFEGGANDFKIFSENLIPRVAATQGLLLEVWAYDRRSNQLEDQTGLDIAEAHADPLIALDWMFGAELTLPLSPELAAGPNRRAVFYNAQSETAYIANWTPLVFSRDIDAIVEKARTVAKNGNVFLGGHSAGTGFTARYAATDFDLSGAGPAQPGYAKVRGLVLLEGPGGNTLGAPLTADTLDRIEAKFDGGLFFAVANNSGRCVDGTACTIATEATDCSGKTPPKCTAATGAYSTGLLNPRLLAASQATGIQAINDPDTGRNILITDQGSSGNNAVAKVPDLASLSALPPATAEGGLGSFLDDDGFVASLAPFISTSLGGPGPMVGGLTTWQDITEGPLPPSLLPNNGSPPTALPAGVWGQEKEVTRMDRMTANFYAGHTDFTDWYYPASGLSVTSVAGKCTSGTCTIGNVGASCSTDANCNQAISLDSSALSVGRGRRDIENLTQASGINVPVIAFGASNGLTTVPGAYTPFAQSIGACTAPSCDGTPRVVDASTPNPAFPTFGDVNGGFEVHISEGFAHVDIATAEDDGDNNVLAPLSAFIGRNVQ